MASACITTTLHAQTRCDEGLVIERRLLAWSRSRRRVINQRTAANREPTPATVSRLAGRIIFPRGEPLKQAGAESSAPCCSFLLLSGVLGWLLTSQLHLAGITTHLVLTNSEAFYITAAISTWMPDGWARPASGQPRGIAVLHPALGLKAA